MATRKAKDAAINVAMIQTKPKIPPYLCGTPAKFCIIPIRICACRNSTILVYEQTDWSVIKEFCFPSFFPCPKFDNKRMVLDWLLKL